MTTFALNPFLNPSITILTNDFVPFQEYAFKSVLQNSQQIGLQFKHLQQEYKKGFLFKDFYGLNENRALSIEYEIQSAIKEKSYAKAVNKIPFSSQNHQIRINYRFRLI